MRIAVAIRGRIPYRAEPNSAGESVCSASLNGSGSLSITAGHRTGDMVGNRPILWVGYPAEVTHPRDRLDAP